MYYVPETPQIPEISIPITSCIPMVSRSAAGITYLQRKKSIRFLSVASPSSLKNTSGGRNDVKVTANRKAAI